MKLSDFYERIERMKKIYPFENYATDVRLDRDIRTGEQEMVTITTFDENNQVEIILSAGELKGF